MKYSLDWLISIRKDELNIIELELSDVNYKITDNLTTQSENNNAISRIQASICSCKETWRISALVRSVEIRENSNTNLKAELQYLQKDKEMVLNRYNKKNIEIKMLEKSKSNFISKEKAKRLKKEEAEINELSIIKRKDG